MVRKKALHTAWSACTPIAKAEPSILGPDSLVRPCQWPRAHRTLSADNYLFYFQVLIGSSWTTAITVTKQSDDNVYQDYVLPSTVSGTVRVRVIDSNNSRNAVGLDSVFVDHLVVVAQ